MKKIKLGLFALAAIAGIGGALAFSHKPQRTGTLYYAHKDSDGHVRWYTSPMGICTTYTSLACTITSTSNVFGVVDMFPPQYTIMGSGIPEAVYQ